MAGHRRLVPVLHWPAVWLTSCQWSLRQSGQSSPLAQTPLMQLRRLIHHIRREPHHVLQMLRPVAAGPVDAFAVAAPQQRLQLLQPVLQKVCRAGSVRDGGGGAGGRLAAGCRCRGPGHNSFSHLLCFLSKLLHVMWLDGRGADTSRPSPFVPRVFHRVRMAPMARREAKRSSFKKSALCSAPSLLHTVRRRATGASTLERDRAGGETECASKSRIAQVSFFSSSQVADG